MKKVTKKIELRAARRYQYAFTSNSVNIKEVLNSLRDANIDIEGEIESVSKFSQAGEANIRTSTHNYFLIINW